MSSFKPALPVQRPGRDREARLRWQSIYKPSHVWNVILSLTSGGIMKIRLAGDHIQRP